MTTITPIENGLHSLAKGLEAFNIFHSDPSNAFALKDGVLRTHHAVETLSKAALFELNPVFVLKSEIKVDKFISRFEEFAEGKNSFIVDEESTIGLADSLDRLHKIGELRGFPEREFFQLKNAAEELEEFRNALQHFAIKVNLEIVARVLGNIIPRFVDLLDVLSKSTRRFWGSGYSIMRLQNRAVDLSGFRKKLDDIYPESGRVIELLRSRYDQLIRQAVEFFSEREFPDTELHVKVEDHGRVGAPPYMPGIFLKGPFELSLDVHRLIFQIPEESFKPEKDNQPQITAYDASLKISNPTKLEDQGPFKVVHGSIELKATNALQQANSAIRLPNAEEYIPLLRNIEIKLAASIAYKAVAIYDQWHYDVQKILDESGSFKLTIAAVPSGYEADSRKHLLFGNLSFDLDKDNAPFRLHSFVELDGNLRDHHIFEWSMAGRSVLRFAK
jgi:hypothetical protein